MAVQLLQIVVVVVVVVVIVVVVVEIVTAVLNINLFSSDTISKISVYNKPLTGISYIQ